MDGRHRKTYLGCVAAVLLGASVAVALRASGEANHTSPLQLAQTASAETAGIRIEVLAATFSAGNTLVQLQVDVSSYESQHSNSITRVTATPADFAGGTLRPIEPGKEVVLRFSASEPVIIRLTEAPLDGPYRMVIRSLTVQASGGSPSKVTGPWTLELSAPGNLRDRLRSETLTGRADATDEGLTVRVVGGRRTTAETLVTVEVLRNGQSVGVDLLTEPYLESEGTLLSGGVAQQREGGSLLTLSFPPTKFGAPARLQLGPWSIRNDDVEGPYSDVDLGLGRAKLQAGEEITPIVAAVEGSADSPVISVALATTHLMSGDVPTIRFMLRGNYQSSATSLRAVLPDGTSVRAGEVISSYRKAPDGTVSTGTTEVHFTLGKLDSWTGLPVRIYHGRADELVRGRWSLDLTPVP